MMENRSLALSIGLVMDFRTKVFRITNSIWLGPFASPERKSALTAARITHILNVGEAPNASTKIILATCLFFLTAGISIVRYRNPDLFKKANPILYMAAYGVSFGIALVLAFLGGVILYGF